MLCSLLLRTDTLLSLMCMLYRCTIHLDGGLTEKQEMKLYSVVSRTLLFYILATTATLWA